MNSNLAGKIRYYKEYGETDALRDVEAQLTDEWQTAAQIAKGAGRSPYFAKIACQYLTLEHRAEQTTVKMRRKTLMWRRRTHV